MTGFIYAVECNGRVKIGHSNDPEKRFSKIGSDAPHPCVLLGYWPATTAEELEVHAKFNADRCHGEWFAATAELLAFIAANMQARVKQGKRHRILPTDSPLAAWRKTARLRQAELGAMIGVGSSFISQMENGISGASLQIAVEINRLSNGAVPIESLLVRPREAVQ